MDLQNMEQKTYFMYFCITICLHRSGFYLCKVQVKQNKKVLCVDSVCFMPKSVVLISHYFFRLYLHIVIDPEDTAEIFLWEVTIRNVFFVGF